MCWFAHTLVKNFRVSDGNSVGKYSEAMAPQQATVICQLLHFPAHSWSVLFQHSWPSPFLLPLCKWLARSLSWKNLEWAQAGTKVDIREQTRTNGRELISLPWNPGLQAIPVPVNTGVVGPGVLQRALSPQPFRNVFQSIESVSFHQNHRIIQSVSRKWAYFLRNSGRQHYRVYLNPEITKQLGCLNMTLKEWSSAKPAHVSLQQTALQPQKAHVADDLEKILTLLWTWQTHMETVANTTRGVSLQVLITILLRFTHPSLKLYACAYLLAIMSLNLEGLQSNINTKSQYTWKVKSMNSITRSSPFRFKVTHCGTLVLTDSLEKGLFLVLYDKKMLACTKGTLAAVWISKISACSTCKSVSESIKKFYTTLLHS